MWTTRPFRLASNKTIALGGEPMTAFSNLTEVIANIEVATPAKSAIEFIVESAQPGEVISISDEDYYNHQLWRSYQDPA